MVHGARRNAALATRWVVLHGVTSQGGAPLDSTRTDAQGRFVFRIAPVDTTTVYLTSTEWHGIGYFSAPTRFVGRRAADTLPPIEVYDTTSAGPRPRLLRRLVSLARLGEGGDPSWDVLDVSQIENTGSATLVAPDSLHPTWGLALPRQAIQLQAGEGDVSPAAIRRQGDSLVVLGAVAPGAPRQVGAVYKLPGGVTTVDLPIDQTVGQLELMVEGEGVGARAPGLEALGVEDVEGRRFARFRASALQAGATVTIVLPRAPLGPQALVPVVVGIAALALAGGLWFAFRRRPVAGAGSVH